jgi:threonine synthase
MRTLGLIRRTPKLLGVQAAGAAPVTEAFRSGAALRAVEPHTMADSIAVGVPRNWKKAVDAVRESGGTMLNVGDDEIQEAMRATGALAGVFAEPAAAAAVAGLARAAREGIVSRRAATLAVVTGNGLKDTRAALDAAPHPIDIPPDLVAVEVALAP